MRPIRFYTQLQPADGASHVITTVHNLFGHVVAEQIVDLAFAGAESACICATVSPCTRVRCPASTAKARRTTVVASSRVPKTVLGEAQPPSTLNKESG